MKIFSYMFSLIDIFEYSPVKKLVLTLANIITSIFLCLLNYWTSNLTGIWYFVKIVVVVILIIAMISILLRQVIAFTSVIKDIVDKESIAVSIVNILLTITFVIILTIYLYTKMK